jgi:hypothetical protein
MPLQSISSLFIVCGAFMVASLGVAGIQKLKTGKSRREKTGGDTMMAYIRHNEKLTKQLRIEDIKLKRKLAKEQEQKS